MKNVTNSFNVFMTESPDTAKAYIQHRHTESEKTPSQGAEYLRAV